MRRVVFLGPPAGDATWDHLVRARAREMTVALEGLHLEVLQLTTDDLIHRHDETHAVIARFDPDLITAPNFNYLLLASLLSTDLFEQPTPVLALWDDPLGALVNYAERKAWFWEREALESPPIVPASGFSSAVSMFARALRLQSDAALCAPAQFKALADRPNVVHFGWDSGHIQAMRQLQLVRADRVHWAPVATYQPFLDMGAKSPSLPAVRDVAFCGNLYLHSFERQLAHLAEPLLQVVNQVCAAKEQSLDRSVWDLLLSSLAQLPAAVCRAHQLLPNQRAFWDLYKLVAWNGLNARVRLAILSSIRRRVNVFGLFADPESAGLLHRHPNLDYQGHADHFTELPAIYATTRINVCVTNGLIYQGTPSKLFDCVASGGFALCDPKADLVRIFGPIVEEIFFRNADELNDKIEYFLSRPRKRQEITEAMRERIVADGTVTSLFQTAISAVSHCLGSAA